MLELLNLIQQCVTPQHQVVMSAIVKVESSGKPLAIGLNKGYRLQTQPKDEAQAKAWVEYLEKNNYNFDVGLGQVNIKNIHKYGYKASDMLEPCLNLKISSDILDKNYKLAATSANDADAIKKAISAYNTGNFSSGFKNGYVAKVTSKLAINNTNNSDVPPIISTSKKSLLPAQIVEVKPVKNTANKNNQSIELSPTENSNPYTAKTVMYVAPPKKLSAGEY